jgi:predicted RNA-binding protein
MTKNYWMVVQTAEDFEISREMGFTLHGLKSRQRRRAQRMEPDDRLLYYVSSIRKWTAIATVTSKFFEDRAPVWSANGAREVYPYRVRLSPLIVLDEKEYIDALILAPRLEYIKRWPPERWPLAFVDNIHLLPQRDYRLIEGEMKRVHSKWRNKRRRGRRQRGPGRGRAPGNREEQGPVASNEPVPPNGGADSIAPES